MSKLKKWELLEEQDVSPSKWFPLFKHKVKLPDGTVIDDYYVSKLGDVAMIVAFTSKKEIILVRQYKHGAGEVIIELPAGRVSGYDPENTAKNELREETGYIAEELEHIQTIFFEPSKDTLKVYGYLVRNVDVQVEQKLDITEDIEVVLIPGNKVENMIISGEICSSDTLAFLYLTKLKYPELFE